MPRRCQTLIVAGAKDRFYSSELFAETERLILHARLMLLPRRGHVTALADPRFARAALAFLSGPPVAGKRLQIP